MIEEIHVLLQSGAYASGQRRTSTVQERFPRRREPPVFWLSVFITTPGEVCTTVRSFPGFGTSETCSWVHRGGDVAILGLDSWSVTTDRNFAARRCEHEGNVDCDCRPSRTSTMRFCCRNPSLFLPLTHNAQAARTKICMFPGRLQLSFVSCLC
jgi:hypothetical protein